MRLLKNLLVLLAVMCSAIAHGQTNGPENMTLLPLPHRVEMSVGTFRIDDEVRIFLPVGMERPELLASENLQGDIAQYADAWTTFDRIGRLPYTGAAIYLDYPKPEVKPQDEKAAQGYTLEIAQGWIHIWGNSPAGLYYGIQTLRQLVKQYGATLPAMKIVDQPDFAARGFYHDVSRGKVPKVETLEYLIDRLAELKVNQFQLYVEHPFMFRFDPAIAHNPDGLTPQDIIELDAYCKDRRIDFVPSLQSFGHMAGVLQLPQYRHLAEVEMKEDWKDLVWRPRMRGATINVRDPEAMALLGKMHDEYLPLFSSGLVNVCADETYDLGEGKNKLAAASEGKANLYLSHIINLNNMVHAYGKQMMFWGDIVKKHPEVVPQIPKDIILLDWGYSAKVDTEGTALFAKAGLKFYVCPGVSGWNRILNNINNADLNIRRYAAAGMENGAYGLLNTDWGDQGHFNALAGSLHGVALGAAMAWNASGPNSDTFDRSWSSLFFNDPAGETAKSLRAQSISSSTWVLLHTAFQAPDWQKMREASSLTREDAQTLIVEGERGAKLFDGFLKSGNHGNADDLAELRLGSKLDALLGEKLLIWFDLTDNNGKQNKALAKRMKKFAGNLKTLAAEYETQWRVRNRESELRDIHGKFEALLAESNALAVKLTKK
ncbi:family 20 glycosylhydrolase [soil metagenome]